MATAITSFGAAPAANNRRRDAGIDQALEPAIGELKICGIHDAEVFLQVGHPTFVLPTRLEQPKLVGVGTQDDLNDRKPLLLAVGSQLLKPLKGDPLAQPLPPGIAQPEERCAIGVLKMPLAL